MVLKFRIGLTIGQGQGHGHGQGLVWILGLRQEAGHMYYISESPER